MLGVGVCVSLSPAASHYMAVPIYFGYGGADKLMMI
jgi:hypothetical protein